MSKTPAEHSRAWRDAHPGAQYAANKKWRLTHPEQRHAEKKRRNDKTRGRENEGARWSQEEERLVMDPKLTDRQVADRLRRSVGAVSQRRYRIRQRP